MKKPLIIGGAVALLLLIIAGGYFITRANKLNALITKKNTLQEDFAIAVAKLNNEKDTLVTLSSGLRNSFPLTANVQDQMRKAADLVRRTDFIFTDANGDNPKIIVKNPLTQIPINTERKDINTLLLRWQNETSISSMQTMDANESAKVKADAETIKNFINDLAQISAGLTPANSGLSEFQIASYTAMLPSIAAIDAVLSSLSFATGNSGTNNPAIPGIQNNTGANGQSPPSPVSAPAVTAEDVIHQQAVVAQAQAVVAAVQEQITEIEAQIEQISPSPSPSPTPPPSPEIVTPPSGTPPPGPAPAPAPAPTPTPPASQGIIEQSGEPELIQGTNPY